jgi:hypothetical protein
MVRSSCLVLPSTPITLNRRQHQIDKHRLAVAHSHTAHAQSTQSNRAQVTRQLTCTQYEPNAKAKTKNPRELRELSAKTQATIRAQERGNKCLNSEGQIAYVMVERSG